MPDDAPTSIAGEEKRMIQLNTKLVSLVALTIASAAVMAQDASPRPQGGNQGGGQRQRGQRGQMGMRNQGGAMLAMREDVQADLQLTADQKTKLDALRDELRAARGNRGGGGVGGNNNRADMQAQRAEQLAKVNAILTPDQQKRFTEIQIQLAGPQALMMADVQKALNLTDVQKEKIKSLGDTYREAMTSVREKVRNQELTREQAQAANEKNNDAIKAELEKVLTPAQAEQLKAMGGKPFKATEARGGARRN